MSAPNEPQTPRVITSMLKICLDMITPFDGNQTILNQFILNCNCLMQPNSNVKDPIFQEYLATV